MEIDGQMNFKQRIHQVKEVINKTTSEQVRDEPAILRSLVSDIENLSLGAKTVSDVDFYVEALEIASTFLDHQYAQNNDDYWKKDLKMMAEGILNEIEKQKNGSGWKNIEHYFNGIFPDILNISFVYNGVRTNGLDLDLEEKAVTDNSKKARIKRTSHHRANLTKPITVVSQSALTEDTYQTKMQACLDRLYEVCSFDNDTAVPFYTFAINCESYIQTIYNIFILSFLVRDHLAVMSVDENNQLWIRPAHKFQPGNSFVFKPENRDYGSTFQQILSINPMEWKKLIKALGLTSSMLPVIDNSPECLTNNAYDELTQTVQFVK